jgi:hypothetical protein
MAASFFVPLFWLSAVMSQYVCVCVCVYIYLFGRWPVKLLAVLKELFIEEYSLLGCNALYASLLLAGFLLVLLFVPG